MAPRLATFIAVAVVLGASLLSEAHASEASLNAHHQPVPMLRVDANAQHKLGPVEGHQRSLNGIFHLELHEYGALMTAGLALAALAAVAAAAFSHRQAAKEDLEVGLARVLRYQAADAVQHLQLNNQLLR